MWILLLMVVISPPNLAGTSSRLSIPRRWEEVVSARVGCESWFADLKTGLNAATGRLEITRVAIAVVMRCNTKGEIPIIAVARSEVFG